MKRVLAVILALLLSVEVLPASAHAHERDPFCGIRWGSLAKHGTQPTDRLGFVENVRTGRHECFDRLVIDVAHTWAG